MFSFEKVNEEFEKDIAKINSMFDKYKLSHYMGKLYNGNVQVVLMSGTSYVDEINEIAKTVHSLLATCKLLIIIMIFYIVKYYCYLLVCT